MRHQVGGLSLQTSNRKQWQAASGSRDSDASLTHSSVHGGRLWINILWGLGRGKLSRTLPLAGAANRWSKTHKHQGEGLAIKYYDAKVRNAEWKALCKIKTQEKKGTLQLGAEWKDLFSDMKTEPHVGQTIIKKPVRWQNTFNIENVPAGLKAPWTEPKQ